MKSARAMRWLLVGVLAACGASSPRPAPAIVGVCNGLAECTAQCASGHAASCRRVIAFGPRADFDRWLAAIEPTLTRACEARTGHACWALAQAVCVRADDDPPAPDDCATRAVELFARGCDQGEGVACSDLAYFAEDASDEERERWRERATAIFESDCQDGAGDYAACLALELSFLGFGPENERLNARLSRACHDERDALACWVLAEGLETDDPNGAASFREQACAITRDHVGCE